MTYKIKFLPKAEKEWQKLDNPIREAFKKALAKRIVNPIVPKDRLSGTKKECYKIKLRNFGFRLVYTLEQEQIILVVIAVGKRENDEIYKLLENRLENLIT